MTLSELGLSHLVRRRLARGGIHSVTALVRHTAGELLTIWHFGPSHLRQVREALGRAGLSLNGDVSPAPRSQKGPSRA